MSGFEVLLSFCVWFGLGGWAFYNLNDGENAGGALLICIALAPFAAGVALAKLRHERAIGARKT